MKNDLFIVCPFSCMELYLQRKFNSSLYFVTGTAANINYHETENVEAISRFIQREHIQTITFVNDTSCAFINGVIDRKAPYGMQCELDLVDLFIENYFTHFKGKSADYQRFKLSELNVKKQVNDLINSSILGNLISANNIEVNGLVTSQEKNLITELINTKNLIYEL